MNFIKLGQILKSMDNKFQCLFVLSSNQRSLKITPKKISLIFFDQVNFILAIFINFISNVSPDEVHLIAANEGGQMTNLSKSGVYLFTYSSNQRSLKISLKNLKKDASFIYFNQVNFIQRSKRATESSDFLIKRCQIAWIKFCRSVKLLTK